MQNLKRTHFRLLDKSLPLVFVLSLIGNIQAQSETQQPGASQKSEPQSASQEWRSPTKGYWEYAEENWLFSSDAKKVIPTGYGVIVLDESTELTPLKGDFLETFCQDRYPLPGSLEVKSVVALLYHGQIPSGTEIQTICTIMDTLLFKEKWSQSELEIIEEQIYLYCHDNKQMTVLYDEALRRLKRSYSKATIVDICIGQILIAHVQWTNPKYHE